MPDPATPQNGTIDTSPDRVPKQASAWNMFGGIRGARRIAMADEERQLKAADIINTRQSILAKLPDLTGKDKDDANQALVQANYDIGQLYHPINNPGALQKDWHWLREKVHGIKQPTPTPTQSPAVTLPAFAPAPITTPEMPAYQQTTPGLPSQGGGVTTTVPGVAATTMPGMAGAPITLPAVPLPKVTKMPWAAGRVQELKDKAMQKAQEEAKTLEAGAGLSPEQVATVNANAANAGSLAAIQGKIKNYRTLYRTLNPSATEEEESKDVSAYASSLIPGNEQIGNWEVRGGSLDGQNYPLSYDKKRGMYKLPDGSISSTPPENWKESPKATGVAAQNLSDYNNDPDPNKGDYAEWIKKKQTISGIKFDPNSGQVIDSATGKRYSRNDTNLPPEVAKLFSSQQETAAEKQQKAIALVYARGQAMGASRYVMVAHPDGTVTYMSAGDASKSDAQSPAGIAFKTDAAMQRNLLGGGKIGQSILAYKTAAAHLDMLQKAADALNNGDIQFSNRTANAFNTAIGMPAPTNFDAIKAAVIGEIAKTFSTSVTLDDKAAILETINNAQSPAQIYGAIETYRKLMLSKANAAEAMGTAASQGLADSFKGGTNTSPNSVGGNAPKSKGSRSLAAAMALPVNKGKSADEVQKHLESLGYTVTKP